MTNYLTSTGYPLPKSQNLTGLTFGLSAICDLYKGCIKITTRHNKIVFSLRNIKMVQPEQNPQQHLPIDDLQMVSAEANPEVQKGRFIEEVRERLGSKDTRFSDVQEATELADYLDIKTVEERQLAVGLVADTLQKQPEMTLRGYMSLLESVDLQASQYEKELLHPEAGAGSARDSQGLIRALDVNWQTLPPATKLIASALGVWGGCINTKFSWQIVVVELIEGLNEDPEELEKISEEQTANAKKELTSNGTIYAINNDTDKMQGDVLSLVFFRVKGREL
jgi:hypothetical protein